MARAAQQFSLPAAIRKSDIVETVKRTGQFNLTAIELDGVVHSPSTVRYAGFFGAGCGDGLFRGEHRFVKDRPTADSDVSDLNLLPNVTEQTATEGESDVVHSHDH